MGTNDTLRPAARLAAALSHLHALGVAQRAAYLAVLRSIFDGQPATNGIWCVWEPNALDGRDAEFRHAPGHDATGRFVPHWHRTRGHPKLDPVTGYDERRLGTWYHVPIQRALPCTVEPYLYPIDNAIHCITSQVAPILSEGRCLGVVGIDRLARQASATPQLIAPTVRPMGSSGERVRPLTPREREVHHWLSEGKTNDEIAIILGISPHTVKNHLDHIFQKLGVENRHAAAAIK